MGNNELGAHINEKLKIPRYVSSTYCIRPTHRAGLTQLAKETGITQSQIVRTAIEAILDFHKITY